MHIYGYTYGYIYGCLWILCFDHDFALFNQDLLKPATLFSCHLSRSGMVRLCACWHQLVQWTKGWCRKQGLYALVYKTIMHMMGTTEYQYHSELHFAVSIRAIAGRGHQQKILSDNKEHSKNVKTSTYRARDPVFSLAIPTLHQLNVSFVKLKNTAAAWITGLQFQV